MRPSSADLARMFGRVTVDVDGCWNFSAVNYKGYGVFDGGCAHRVAYQWFVGPIPAGLHIDHLCFNRSCVNPAHMEPVTVSENTRRGNVWVRTGRCLNGGHLITPENIYTWRKHGVLYRTCRACRMASRRRWINRSSDGIQHRLLLGKTA